MPQAEFTRRAFLAASAAALAATGVPTSTAQSPNTTPPDASTRHARNLIFMMADGLSLGALTLGDLAARKLHHQPLHWLDWIATGAPRLALLATDSADRIITDSAAAASAWSIGLRVNNDALSVTPDGHRPPPLLVRLKQAGFLTGALTTTDVLDASPAAMLANADRRADFPAIAQQYLQGAVDLIIGGGFSLFDPDDLRSAPNLRLLRSLPDLRSSLGATDRLFALLADRDLTTEIDRTPNDPSFSDLVRAALDHFTARTANTGARFALFLESEDTDTAAHDNDAATLAHAVLAFDQGLAVALQYCDSHPDTLLIVTTDHSNANPGFARYAATAPEQLDRLCAAKRSFRAILDRFRSAPAPRNAAALAALLSDGQGVTLADDEIEILDRWLAKVRVDPFDLRNRQLSPLGSLVGNHLGVAFNSSTHTADHVIATAQGPGATALPPVGHLVDIHHLILNSLGLA